MSHDRPVVAVIGATGAQGGAVVRALTVDGAFAVRAVTRDPSRYTGPAAEVVAADLADPASLETAFAGVYGVFAMSNFTGSALDEFTQGRHAVEAAVGAGVQHFVWSTQPNVEQTSGGEFQVPHFTDKARVDEVVRDASFERYTFVIPPFYFENFLTSMAPQLLPDGSTGWAVPIPAEARVVHAASIEDLGGVVTGAFGNPDDVGAGAYLSSAAVLMSFDDFGAALRAQGHSIAIVEVPPAVYATFYPGADEMAQMFGYWAKHTYLGPNGQDMVDIARKVSTTPSTDFAAWTAGHMAITPA